MYFTSLKASLIILISALHYFQGNSFSAIWSPRCWQTRWEPTSAVFWWHRGYKQLPPLICYHSKIVNCQECLIVLSPVSDSVQWWSASDLIICSTEPPYSTTISLKMWQLFVIFLVLHMIDRAYAPVPSFGSCPNVRGKPQISHL